MRTRAWWLVGLAIAVLVVVVLTPMASSEPDGLQRVAQDSGFLAAAQDALYSILPDYTVPGIEDARLTTILAGLVGVGLVFAIMWGLGLILARRRGHPPD